LGVLSTRALGVIAAPAAAPAAGFAAGAAGACP
jgi:hypothetical protein